MINLSLSPSWLYQIFFYLYWLSYPSSHHGWFSITHCNHLLLISSHLYGCLILVTFSLQYHCASPCFYSLIFLLVTIVLSLYIQFLISSPHQYYFAYPYLNFLFASSISLLLSLSQSYSTCWNNILFSLIPLLLLIIIDGMLILVFPPPRDLILLFS